MGDRWYVVLKKTAQNSNVKKITGERTIGGTWYYKNLAQNTNLLIVMGERAIVVTWY